jgi:hypothetical protein
MSGEFRAKGRRPKLSFLFLRCSEPAKGGQAWGEARAVEDRSHGTGINQSRPPLDT